MVFAELDTRNFAKWANHKRMRARVTFNTKVTLSIQMTSPDNPGDAAQAIALISCSPFLGQVGEEAGPLQRHQGETAQQAAGSAEDHIAH